MKGYMCFFEDMTDLQHDKFEIGKTYTEKDKKKRYTIYDRLEDSLRNYHGDVNDVIICIVEGSGEGRQIADTVYEYIGRYEFENITIIKALSREFIIEYGLNLYEERLIRFLQGFKLTDEEKEKFRVKFGNYYREESTIDYYINENKNAYKEEKEKEKHIKL